MKAKRHWDIEELGERMEGVAEVFHSRARQYAASIASGLVIAAIVAGPGEMSALRTQSFANKNTILIRPFTRTLPRDESVSARRVRGEFQPDVDEGFSTARLGRLGGGLFTPLDEDEIIDLDVSL
jgi:hypothetical protein